MAVWRYHSPVAKLALTIEDALLESVRKVAHGRNTSVDQIVSDYLSDLVAETEDRRAAVADFDEIFRTISAERGDRTWTRDELHERR